MDEGRRLDELLRALFRTDAELRRFLVLQGFSVADIAAPMTKVQSRAETSSQVARTLDEQGLITPALFEALERRAPERRPDIQAVAQLYLGAAAGSEPPAPEAEEAASGEATARDPVAADRSAVPRPATHPSPATRQPSPATAASPRFAAFAASLRAELVALEPIDPAIAAAESERWPWTGAAAVLGSFRPSDLRPLLVGRDGSRSDLSTSALTALADSVFTTFHGRWVLRDDVRMKALERLQREDALDAALAANEELPDSRRDLLRQLLRGDAPALPVLDARSLDDLDVVTSWLEPLGVKLAVNRAAILAAAERRQLIDPLRALVGTHFRGRAEELETLRQHVQGARPEAVLLLRGAGGAGKSTLIGKVLLDLEDQAAFDPVSFAYVDFDKARHDPRQPRALLEQIARQLRLLYANAEEGRAFAAVESYAGGTDVALASEILDIEPDLDVGRQVEVLSERLTQVAAAYRHAPKPPLVLVLDTFEEVQIKGPGAVRDILDLVDRLRAAMPAMRLIVAGRAVVTEFRDTPTVPLPLGDLDAEAADAVLEHLGVREAGLRALIVTRFGRNPLTLRLAAEALSRLGSADAAFAGELARADVLARVAIEQVQGMLYSRILGHIGDPMIAAMAHPGLVVRRVTVDVIREVLAEPCQLDPDRAGEIFERLRQEVTMFEPDGPDALRHRQDVRRLMLRAMLDEPGRRPQVEEIHRRAIPYYTSRPELADRAEELYHRLMSGQDPRDLGRLWTSGMENLLASAVEEPLPAPARRWLERRLGLAPLDEQHEWDQDDWEANAASRAESWLASGDARNALAVLQEREERLPGSRLYALEVAAHLAADDLARATEVLALGLRSVAASDDRAIELDLAEQSIHVHARRGDAAEVIEAARTVATLCDLTGQRARAIVGLADAIEQLLAVGAEAEAAGLIADLTARFSHMTRAEMQERPDVVLRVLHTAGQTDSAVLVHAALQVGDQTDTAGAVFIDDVFPVERLLQQVTRMAAPALTDLATEVGLDARRWDVRELASLAVRTGRVGKAIALGLDYAEDDDAARHLVTEALVRPENTVA